MILGKANIPSILLAVILLLSIAVFCLMEFKITSLKQRPAYSLIELTNSIQHASCRILKLQPMEYSIRKSYRTGWQGFGSFSVADFQSDVYNYYSAYIYVDNYGSYQSNRIIVHTPSRIPDSLRKENSTGQP